MQKSNNRKSTTATVTATRATATRATAFAEPFMAPASAAAAPAAPAPPKRGFTRAAFVQWLQGHQCSSQRYSSVKAAIASWMSEESGEHYEANSAQVALLNAQGQVVKSYNLPGWAKDLMLASQGGTASINKGRRWLFASVDWMLVAMGEEVPNRNTSFLPSRPIDRVLREAENAAAKAAAKSYSKSELDEIIAKAIKAALSAL